MDWMKVEIGLDLSKKVFGYDSLWLWGVEIQKAGWTVG